MRKSVTKISLNSRTDDVAIKVSCLSDVFFFFIIFVIGDFNNIQVRIVKLFEIKLAHYFLRITSAPGCSAPQAHRRYFWAWYMCSETSRNPQVRKFKAFLKKLPHDSRRWRRRQDAVPPRCTEGIFEPDIRVQRPQKPPSKKFQGIYNKISPYFP